MKKVVRIGLKRKPKVTAQEMALTSNVKTRVELIRTLIPIGLEAVAEELKHEVEQLADQSTAGKGDCLALPLGESKGVDLSL